MPVATTSWVTPLIVICPRTVAVPSSRRSRSLERKVTDGVVGDVEEVLGQHVLTELLGRPDRDRLDLGLALEDDALVGRAQRRRDLVERATVGRGLVAAARTRSSSGSGRRCTAACTAGWRWPLGGSPLGCLFRTGGPLPVSHCSGLAVRFATPPRAATIRAMDAARLTPRPTSGATTGGAAAATCRSSSCSATTSAPTRGWPTATCGASRPSSATPCGSCGASCR